jgi:hypothetical protein
MVPGSWLIEVRNSDAHTVARALSAESGEATLVGRLSWGAANWVARGQLMLPRLAKLTSGCVVVSVASWSSGVSTGVSCFWFAGVVLLHCSAVCGAHDGVVSCGGELFLQIWRVGLVVTSRAAGTVLARVHPSS